MKEGNELEYKSTSDEHMVMLMNASGPDLYYLALIEDYSGCDLPYFP